MKYYVEYGPCHNKPTDTAFLIPNYREHNQKWYYSIEVKLKKNCYVTLPVAKFITKLFNDNNIRFHDKKTRMIAKIKVWE